MTENEAIKELKDENEQCYYQCDGCCSEVEGNVCTCRDAIIISVLEQYRAIGTVEECREARERQRGRKPIIKSKKKTKIQTGDYVDVKCPCCEEDIFSCFHYPPWNDSQKSHKHCENCGQAIDWSETV